MSVKRVSALYTSPRIQNEIISLLGAQIQAKITAEIRRNRFFSVLFDETTDVSQQEQGSLVLRFVDEVGDVHKTFLGFVVDYNTTGAGLAKLIKEFVLSLGLDMSDCRGQGYDGAASMQGKFRGVKTIIQNEYRLALN